MPHNVILSKNAPAPIGPYSQAIEANGFLFVSGQIALDPATGDLVTSDIQSETHTVLKHIGSILAARGLDYTNVVKCSVFVMDIKDFGAINEVYAGYFNGTTPPARELVQVAHLPKSVNVEISVIAAIPQ